MELQYKKQLVDFLGQLMPVTEGELNSIFPYIHQKKFKSGAIITSIGELDIHSRFICKGFIGLYKETDTEANLENIFGEEDMAREFHSYYSGERKNYFLKSISETIVLEISKIDQERILDKDSKMAILTNKVMDFIIQRRSIVTGLRILDLSSGYEELLKVFPGIGIYLTRNDLASFFNCSVSKVARWRRDLSKK